MHDHALASLYHTKSDSGKLIDILTLTTAFPYEPPEEDEERVVAVSNRRTDNKGAFEYETHWADGDVTWEPASQFMDSDGKFNILFLDYAQKEDIAGALDGLTNAQLEEICDAQCWKVLWPSSSLVLPCLTFSFLQKAGPKQNLIDRIVKKTLAVKQDALTWANVRMEAAVLDPVPGPDSTPGRIRSFYTKSYKSLDQFDQLWYEVQYDKRQTWECNYVWAIIVASIINGRSAYCESCP
jgi:hypothetical protein